MEAFQSQQLPLTITFIDCKKAFDSINREVMFSVLRHYGIPDKLVKAIGALYNNSKSAVMVDGNISEPFQVTTGVLQGDVLAPFLFIVLIDYIDYRRQLRILIQEWWRIHGNPEDILQKS